MSAPPVHLTPATTDETLARKWFEQFEGAGLDGIIAKPLGDVYVPDKRTMFKVKHERTADCVVAGYRPHKSGPEAIGSLLLGLYGDDGLLHHVGFTSSFTTAERAELVAKVEPLKKAPGFTGRAPGGPSRWSTERSEQWEPLSPELVVEVLYDHFSEGRFRHGTKLLRWRPDKAPHQCTMDQVVPQRVAGPSPLGLW